MPTTATSGDDAAGSSVVGGALALLALVADLSADIWSLAAIAYAYGVWPCVKDGFLYPWAPQRPCPQCGTPGPATYDAPAA